MTGLHREVLSELEPDECWRLLEARPVGRLAWTGPTGPVIVPTNYAVVDRTLRLRTTAYGALAREVDDSLVAFEVDELDDATRTGWSVLVRARARLAYPGGAGRHHHGAEPWPAGPRPVQVVLEPHSVSGRRLGPAEVG